MTRVELTLTIAVRIRHRIERIRHALGTDASAFSTDEGRVEQVAFNVFLAMQGAVDLAMHVVSDEQWGAPETLAESFDLLQEHGVLAGETATAMRRGTKLRNLIAHDYGRLDPMKLHRAASESVAELEAFLADVDRWLSSRQPTSA